MITLPPSIPFKKKCTTGACGDWQLLSWLAPKVSNRSGKLLPVDLSILTRWQMIDNLRRSLLSPSFYLILLLALTILPGSPVRWIAIVILTWFLPVIRQLTVIQTVFRHTKGLLFTAGQVLVTTITLPFKVFCCSMLLAGPCTVYPFLKEGYLNG